MSAFLLKFWNLLKPQAGKAVAFVVGAAASAFGAALSPETLDGLADFISKAF